MIVPFAGTAIRLHKALDVALDELTGSRGISARNHFHPEAADFVSGLLL
jgi:hypothetical protein